MIGEFVPARIGDAPILLVGVDILNRQALVADTGGALSVVRLYELSIDWHYDSNDGKWKPDFDEG